MLIDKAIRLNKTGLEVLALNRKKQPLQKTWGVSKQTEAELRNNFTADTQAIGIVTKDGLEAIDFDIKYYHKDLDILKEYGDYIKKVFNADELFKKLVIQKTPSGGIHLVYKSPINEGNQKLARNPSGQAFIETRGRKGYIVVAPSKGYKLLRNDFESIPELTADERQILIVGAKCFDYHHSKKSKSYTLDETRQLREKGEHSWEVYDLKNDVLEVIESNGWSRIHESGEWIQFTRPNTGSGEIHASYNTEQHFFNVFTTADTILEDRGYSPSALYALLEHNGDFREAGRSLYNKGYGNISQETKELTEIEKLMLDVMSTKFDYNKKIEWKDTCFKIRYKDESFYRIADFGGIVGVVGKQKSMKTTGMVAIAASGLSNQRILNFDLKLKGRKCIWLDTEQDEDNYATQQKRILDMAAINNNSNLHEAYNLRRFSIEERVLAIDMILSEAKNVGVVFLDGLVDICPNIMESTDSRRTIDKVMQWSEMTGALFVVALHLTKGGNGFPTVRGHLGTELQNKATAIIEFRKHDDLGCTEVMPRDTRYREFQSYYFKRDDETGHPFLTDDEEYTEINVQEQMNDYQESQPKVIQTQIIRRSHPDMDALEGLI